MPAWIPTLVGIAIILVTGRDILHEMFHPEETGSISRWVMHHAWRLIRWIAHGHRGVTKQAGPLLLVLVALTWTTLVVVAWALIYWPRVPAEFTVSPGVPGWAAHGFGAALYVSLADVTTLSAGNLTPIATVPRIASTIEAFVGPVMLTAWISWVLAIYPILADRRAFAYRAHLLRRTYGDPISVVRDCPPDAIIRILHTLTDKMLAITAELRQSRVTYYFQSDVIQGSLTMQLPYVLAMAREAERSASSAGVQHHGRMLRIAIDGFLDDIGAAFVDQKGATSDEILAALAHDHLLPPPGSEQYEALVAASR
jgi:hypothetical protein